MKLMTYKNRKPDIAVESIKCVWEQDEQPV